MFNKKLLVFIITVGSLLLFTSINSHSAQTHKENNSLFIVYQQALIKNSGYAANDAEELGVFYYTGKHYKTSLKYFTESLYFAKVAKNKNVKNAKDMSEAYLAILKKKGY